MELLRHQRLNYLNTSVDETAVYSLIGKGFTDLTVAANAKTAEKQYIHEKNASNGLTGYAPTMTFTSVMDDSDEVSVYIQGLADRFIIGSGCKTDIVIVDAWKEGTTEGCCIARKQGIMIQIDNPGSSAAGLELALSGTFNYVGEPVEGEFNLSTKTFKAKA